MIFFNHRSKFVALSSVLLCACATPTVVQSVKPGDNGLSCAQLQNEYVDAERFRSEADKEKSVTGGNVVRALLFWPAILGTASNANEAIAAADSRKVHLANQMNQKNCSIPGVSQLVDNKVSDPAQANTVSGTPTNENNSQKLRDLQTLRKDGVITEDEFLKKKQQLLEKL
ncbi:MAG: SHOCT domain-containing protein [Gallionella sp.]|nr:SHOCT domain-containing protein [Gallionella sp.]